MGVYMLISILKTCTSKRTKEEKKEGEKKGKNWSKRRQK